MIVAILANAETKKEILSKGTADGTELIWADSVSSLAIIEADAYFDLEFEDDKERTAQLKRLLPAPVFINAVAVTAAQVGKQFFRINAWPGMMQRELLEIATDAPKESIREIFQSIGWKYILLPDLPGFVSARVIAMIINEAYFTLEAGISSKENIDVAMKLGTNYPFGPFEWAEKIGKKNVVQLLKLLSVTDERYAVAPMLEKESAEQKE